MKQGQFIRYLLDLLIAVVIYLVSSLMTKSLYDIQISGILLVFMLVQIILLRQVINKYNNVVNFALIMILILLSVIIQGKQYIIGNLILLGTQGISIIYFNGKDIDKDYYYTISKIILGVLVFSTLFRVGIEKSFLNLMNKIYILIILLSVVLLRSTRNFEKKIKEKNEKIKIISILILIYFICNERLYSFIFNIFKTCLYGILTVVSFVLGIIIYPIAKLLLGFIKQLPQVNDLQMQAGGGNGLEQGIVESYETLSAGVVNVIQFIFIIAIIIAIYFIVTKIKDNKSGETESDGEIIIREKIESMVKVNKKHKERLYSGTDNNTVIKKLFYDIQQRLMKKDLYHQSHTATEVVLAVFRDESNKINKIYNKAKFSNVIISDEELESAKSEYSSIRNEIKNLNKNIKHN